MASEKAVFLKNKPIIWNLNRENGWKEYYALTESNEKLVSLANNCIDNPTKLMNDIETELTKVKFKAFGKVTVRSRPKDDKVLNELQNEKEELVLKGEIGKDALARIDKTINAQIMKIQSESFENEINRLRNMSLIKGRSAMIFKLKEDILGKKVASQESIVMYDSVNNVMLKDRSQIRDASLKYCVNLLINRAPKEEYTDDIALLSKIHDVRMISKEPDEIKLSRDIIVAQLW